MLEGSEHNYIATYYSFNNVLYRAYYNIYIAQLSDFSPNARNPFLYFENLDYEKDMRNYRFTYYINFNDLRGMFIWISRLNLALDPVPSMLIVTTQ